MGVAEFAPVAVVLVLGAAGLLVAYGLSALFAVKRGMIDVEPFSGGLPPAEHAYSRFHVRWYPVTVVFLAFDIEMLFMYPWTLVVSRVGASAAVEMFLFLGILLAGVLYVWHEGAFRWT